MKPSSEEVVYLEDLPEGTTIAPHAFKPKKGVVLKIAGVPVGTCDIDVDDAGNVTYDAEFKRDKMSPELYDVMFGHDVDGTSLLIGHTNVFDEPEPDHGQGKTKAPFRLPRS
jgi:hypothetical protein